MSAGICIGSSSEKRLVILLSSFCLALFSREMSRSIVARGTSDAAAHGVPSTHLRAYAAMEAPSVTRVLPSSITVGCMIEAIVSNGDTEGAYDLLHQVQEDEQCRGTINAVIYCSVLKGFARERKMARALTVYEEIRKKTWRRSSWARTSKTQQ